MEPRRKASKLEVTFQEGSHIKKGREGRQDDPPFLTAKACSLHLLCKKKKEGEIVGRGACQDPPIIDASAPPPPRSWAAELPTTGAQSGKARSSWDMSLADDARA